MDRTEAQTLARTLMDQHGLHHVPFVWTRAKRTLGVTKFRVARGPFMPEVSTVVHIGLSTEFVDILPRDEVEDVIRHEIAHALAGHMAGHGYEWRIMARKVGAKAERCATPSAKPVAPIQGKCPNGHTFEAHRLPQRVKLCPTCPGPYAGRLLTWSKNGHEVPVQAMPVKFAMEYTSLKNRGKI